MTITREQKEKIVSELTSILREAKGVVFADYKGLTVKEFEDLRKRLREQNAKIKVAKLTLMRRALQEAGLEASLEYTAPTAMAYSLEDEVVPAKVIFKFADDTKKLNILSGFLSGKFLAEEDVKSLAKLPGKQELQGQIVSVLVGPMRGMVGVLSGVQRSLLYALQDLAAKKTA